MLNDLDFIVVGHCSQCGNPKYEHFENGIYHTCFCLFHKLPIRKLKLKDNNNKITKVENQKYEEGQEIYGKSS